MSNIIKECYLQQYQSNQIDFKTGFRDLDVFIQNLQLGSIITVGGRPAIGKTELTLSIVNYLLSNNKKILYFNLDTANDVFISRLVANKTHFSINKIYNKQIDLQEIKQSLDFYNDKEINIIGKINLSLEELEKTVKEELPNVIIIDYIQLLKTANEDVDIIQEVKRIAIENNLIVILLSQISRRVERRNDHRPMLADLKDFDSLEELSDVVLMLYRENYYDLDKDVLPYAEVIIRKNNFGSVGICKLNYINEHFTDIEPLF